MYKQSNNGVPTPTANLAINKSRLKVYGKKSEVPTYYLKKGQEFQIELFNPTKDTLLAKISLNGKPIAQGGLVLKPAQRVFLDRYIDVARKFLFDTYEVANTSETRKAIEDNGDFKVEFYKEYIIPPMQYNQYNPTWFNTLNSPLRGQDIDVYGGYYNSCNIGSNYSSNINSINLSNTSAGQSPNPSNTASSRRLSLASMDSLSDVGEDSLDFMDQDLKRTFEPKKELKSIIRSKKSIETGRVEMGSNSDQKLTTVYMNWEKIPFHTIMYKMLPESQKINTVSEISVTRYCTNCGTKNKPTFKFCPTCGTRA